VSNTKQYYITFSFASMLPDNRFKLLSDESDNNITIIGTHKVPLKCNVQQLPNVILYYELITFNVTQHQLPEKRQTACLSSSSLCTIVWHTCEQADIIVFCVTIKLKVSKFKLARKSVLFL